MLEFNYYVAIDVTGFQDNAEFKHFGRNITAQFSHSSRHILSFYPVFTNQATKTIKIHRFFNSIFLQKLKLLYTKWCSLYKYVSYYFPSLLLWVSCNWFCHRSVLLLLSMCPGKHGRQSWDVHVIVNWYYI